MKKILLLFAVALTCYASIAQVSFGGVIRAQNNAGTIANITRNNNGLNVADSIMARKLDSLILTMRAGRYWHLSGGSDTITTAALGTFTIDSTKTRIQQQVNVLNFPAVQPVNGTVAISGTVPVSGSLSTTVNASDSTKYRGTVQVSNLPATYPISGNVGIIGTVPVSGSFSTAINASDSTKYRGTVQVSNLPAIYPVSGTFWQSTQPISAASLPLPSGAATAANQPALVSGRVPVDGSAVTQPVSGTFWQATQPVSGTITANAGTNLNTSALALETGGNLATIAGRTSPLGSNTSANSMPVVIASDQANVNMYTPDVMVTGATAQSTAGNNILLATAGSGSVDAMPSGSGRYRSFYVQIIGGAGITSGQIIFEGSNDNTNFVALPYFDMAVATGAFNNGAISIAASANRFFMGKIGLRYLRCRISTVFAGGTIQALAVYSVQDYVPPINTIGQPAAASLNATIIHQTTTSNASTTTSLNSAATTNATSVKATAGLIYTICAMNTTASVKYVRIYNKASAPTVGTDVPILVIAVPATSSVQVPFSDQGLRFTTGIAYSITGAAAYNDATAVALGDIQLLINYQ